MTTRHFRVLMFVLLVTFGSAAQARHEYGDDRGDDRYVFAMTRSVNQMEAPTLLKATLLPLTVVGDILFLPIAALADAVG